MRDGLVETAAAEKGR